MTTRRKFLRIEFCNKRKLQLAFNDIVEEKLGDALADVKQCADEIRATFVSAVCASPHSTEDELDEPSIARLQIGTHPVGGALSANKSLPVPQVQALLHHRLFIDTRKRQPSSHQIKWESERWKRRQ
jgi:hypothetical protein